MSLMERHCCPGSKNKRLLLHSDQAQALEVVRQIPFGELSDVPPLKVHDANRGSLTQGLNFGSVFGDALFQ